MSWAREPAATLTKRLGRLGYRVSKHRSGRRMARAERPGRRVVVFTMGKTGNKSVAYALREALGTPVFRVHRLTHASVADAERRYRNAQPASRPIHLWEAEHLLGRPATPDAPWDVVTMAREPIAQAVAAFFQSRSLLFDTSVDDAVGLLTLAFADQRDHRTAVNWFDREFTAALGVDVYAHPFDPDRGYGVIETPALRVLILRTESLEVAPNALAEFFGRDAPIALPTHNVSTERRHSAKYKAFAREARIPNEILDFAYGSAYARHFYSEAELGLFRNIWKRADV